MIIFTLLMIISGIVAIPHGNSLGSDSQRLNRTKRDYPVTLRGDPVSIWFIDHNQGLKALVPLIGSRADPIYQHIKFNITRDLGYTSWEIFRSNYLWAEFNKEIHIEFSRTDGEGEKFDVRFIPERFKLSDVKMTYENPELRYKDDMTFIFMNDRQNSVIVQAQSEKDAAFSWCHHLIFSEGIWVGAARVGVKVGVALEGYKIGDHLMLQIMYRVRLSSFASTAGITLKINGDTEITLK